MDKIKCYKLIFPCTLTKTVHSVQRSQDGTDNRQVVIRFGAGIRGYICSKVSRSAQMHTQPSIRLVPNTLLRR